MPRYGYNFPWSGRVGGGNKCIVCGDSGMRFKISSRGACCTRTECIQALSAGQADPVLKAEHDADMEQRHRQWCLKKGIDFDATVANYFQHLGPQSQERDTPIPGAGTDYTVYLKP